MLKYKKNSSKISFKLSILEKNSLNLDLLKLDSKIEKIIKIIYKKLSLGGKIFLCGNGGSAADAQHLILVSKIIVAYGYTKLETTVLVRTLKLKKLVLRFAL